MLIYVSKKQDLQETGMDDATVLHHSQRWYQVRLSVRAMIVLVVVVGCWLGWVAHRARIQREAVQAVMQAGVRGTTISYDWEYKNGSR
jgi:ABC-type polysaccharide/polyol phosphate export permease